MKRENSVNSAVCSHPSGLLPAFASFVNRSSCTIQLAGFWRIFKSIWKLFISAFLKHLLGTFAITKLGHFVDRRINKILNINCLRVTRVVLNDCSKTTIIWFKSQPCSLVTGPFLRRFDCLTEVLFLAEESLSAIYQKYRSWLKVTVTLLTVRITFRSLRMREFSFVV